MSNSGIEEIRTPPVKVIFELLSFCFLISGIYTWVMNPEYTTVAVFGVGFGVGFLLAKLLD